jgi:hypothetical protein
MKTQLNLPRRRDQEGGAAAPAGAGGAPGMNRTGGTADKEGETVRAPP